MKKLSMFFSALVLSIYTSALTVCANPLEPVGSLPFTGDHTPFTLIYVVMGIAAVVIIVLLISMFRKK